MHRTIVLLGLILLAVGVLWPWLSKLGLGRLPGDIRVVRDGFVFYFPLTTGILISVAVSLVFGLVSWLLHK